MCAAPATAWIGFVALRRSSCCAWSSRPLHAEDGYDLWLRYRPLAAERAEACRVFATALVAGTATPTQAATRAELERGLAGLLGTAPALADRVARDGAILVGTPASSPLIAK